MKRMFAMAAVAAILLGTAWAWAQAPGGAPAEQAAPPPEAAPGAQIAPAPGVAPPPTLPRRGPMGPGLYDPQTVTTVRGTVESLGIVRGPGRRQLPATSVNLKTDQGTIPVHLGPAWYLNQQQVALEPGQTLEVTGSLVTLQGQPTIIARAIKVGEKTVQLRDEQGLPLWRGGGRAPGPKGPPMPLKSEK